MVLSSIELFAGAGGLAMGATLAGFKSLGVVEWDRWACDTIRQNQVQGNPLVADFLRLWQTVASVQVPVRRGVRESAGQRLAD